jgi:hypothetical protein
MLKIKIYIQVLKETTVANFFNKRTSNVELIETTARLEYTYA